MEGIINRLPVLHKGPHLARNCLAFILMVLLDILRRRVLVSGLVLGMAGMFQFLDLLMILNCWLGRQHN